MKKNNLFKKVSASVLTLCVLVGSMSVTVPTVMADGDETATSQYELPNKYPVGGINSSGKYNYGAWVDTKNPWGSEISGAKGFDAEPPTATMGVTVLTDVFGKVNGGGSGTYNTHWEVGSSSIKKYSNAEKRFKVGDKYFLLLDKDTDGNYFVMADDLYGTKGLVTISNNTTETSNWFQMGLYGKWVYASENQYSIANWLNNGFLTSGNGTGNKLPDEIINNLVEKDWGVEGGASIADNYFWKTATGTKPESAYTSIAPYTTKQKVSLLSAWEGRVYYDDISPLVYDVKPFESKTVDNVDAYQYKSWYIRTARNDAISGSAIGNGTFMFSTNGSANNTNPYNAFGVRPCFFLDKDFFKTVAVDYSATKTSYVAEGEATTQVPNYVINEIKKVDFADLVALYGTDAAIELKGSDAVDTSVTLQNVYIKGQAVAGNTVTAHVIAPQGVDAVQYSWLHSDAESGTYSVVATGDTLKLTNDHKGYMKLMAIGEKGGKYSSPKETKAFEVTALTGFSGNDITYKDAINDNKKENTFKIKPVVAGGEWDDWVVLDKVYDKDGNPQLFVFAADAPITSNWEHSATGDDNAEKNQNSSQVFDSRITNTWEQNTFTNVEARKFDTVMLSYAKEHNWLTEAGEPSVLPNDYFVTTKLAPLSKWEYEKYIDKIGAYTYDINGTAHGSNTFQLRTPDKSNKIQTTRMNIDSGGNKQIVARGNLYSWSIGLRVGMYLDMKYFRDGYLDTENTSTTEQTAIYDLIKEQYTRQELAGGYNTTELDTIGAMNEDISPDAKNLSVQSLRIDGDLIVDSQVSAKYTYVGDGAESGTTYQWYAMGASGVYEKIDGATEKTFTLTTAQMGREILVEVIPSDGANKGVAATAMTDTVVKTEVFNTSINTDVTIAEGKLTAKLTPQASDDMECMVIVAFYNDDNVLVDVKTQDVSLTEGYNDEVKIEHTYDSGAKKYSIMLWEKGNNKPVMDVKSGTI